MSVIEEIAAERQRQISVEGWSPEHDDEHAAGEMSKAAACYAYLAALPESYRELLADDPVRTGQELHITRRLWPWDWSWFKPKDRRRDLIRAAALIVAEIERRDRAEASSKAKGD